MKNSDGIYCKSGCGSWAAGRWEWRGRKSSCCDTCNERREGGARLVAELPGCGGEEMMPTGGDRL